MTEDQKEDLFQAAVSWLEKIGMSYNDVHTNYTDGTHFIVLESAQIGWIEETYPEHFEDCKLSVQGADLTNGEQIFHVMLPDKFQEVL